ncbi:MAG TPA: nitroreductase family protein, partial [Armatimonadota bacterium]
PTGVNRCELTFTVIDDKAVMGRLQHQVMTALAQAAAENRIPPAYAYLHAATSWRYEYGVKLLFRTAPHALLISAPPDAPCPDQDIALTLGYFDLLAQSAGLGTVWWGMLRMVLATAPELKAFFDLPADHHYFAMLFGLPAVQYPRTVQRDEAAQIKIIAK